MTAIFDFDMPLHISHTLHPAAGSPAFQSELSHSPDATLLLAPSPDASVSELPALSKEWVARLFSTADFTDYPEAKRQRREEESVSEDERKSQLCLSAAAYCDRNACYLPIVNEQTCCSPATARALQPIARMYTYAIKAITAAEHRVRELQDAQHPSLEEEPVLQAAREHLALVEAALENTGDAYFVLVFAGEDEVLAFHKRFRLATDITMGSFPTELPSAELFAESQDPIFITKPAPNFNLPAEADDREPLLVCRNLGSPL